MRVTHRDDGASSASSGARSGPGTTPIAKPLGHRGLRYVPGLDGLRALAVVGVLLFHADLTRAQGGFLGVDLFFVLSGFLITSLLLTEIDGTGHLRFGQFYLRRARRLLPALFVTLAGTLGLALLFARDAVGQVLKDIPFALTYVTNWAYIFRGQSYFETIGRPPLLQHLWSLAIEEQFYLVWPAVVAVLALIFRRHLHRAVIVVAAVGAIASTLFMAWSAQRHGYPDLADPSPIYFATHTHAMGILTGAALAAVMLGRFRPGTVSRRAAVAANCATVAGVAGVVAAFVLASQYDARLYRGGMLAFALVAGLAVAGTAVPGAWAGQMLGRQPLRYIGQRSYGLYLYHWPIFLLLRPGQDVALSGWPNTILRLALTAAVAELSYRYVEMPVRRGQLTTWWRGDPTGPTRASWAGRSQAWRRVGVVALGLALTASILGLVARMPAPAVVAQPRPTPTPIASPVEGPVEGPVVPVATAVPAKPSAPVTNATKTSSTSPSQHVVVRTPAAMVGDSVMLGAAAGLHSEFTRMRLNAVVARQPNAFPQVVKDLRSKGQIRTLVIIHMGTNGYVSAPILRHVLAQLRNVQRVVLVTVHVPRPWTNASNIMIHKIGSRYLNVRIADWAAWAKNHPGWFVKDGAHLTSSGVHAYATLLATTATS